MAVVEAEGPGVPGADGAAVVDFAAGEVAAGVGAVVVDGKKAVRAVEKANLLVTHLHAAVLANGYAFQL